MRLRELIPFISPGTNIILNDYIHKKECTSDMLNSLQEGVKNFEVDKISVMKNKKESALVVMLKGYVITCLDDKDKFWFVCDGMDMGNILTFKDGTKFSFFQTDKLSDTLEYDWLYNIDQAKRLTDNLMENRGELLCNMFGVCQVTGLDDEDKIKIGMHEVMIKAKNIEASLDEKSIPTLESVVELNKVGR